MTELEKLVEHWESKLEPVEREPLGHQWATEITAQDLRLFVDAAKRSKEAENERDSAFKYQLLTTKDALRFGKELIILRTEYKNALEVLTAMLPNLICSFTATQNLPACDSFNNTEELWCSVCKRRKTINKVLTTPSAIAIMKGDRGK